MVQTYFALAKLVQKTMFFCTRLLKKPLFYKENNGTKTCHKQFLKIFNIFLKINLFLNINTI